MDETKYIFNFKNIFYRASLFTVYIENIFSVSSGL